MSMIGDLEVARTIRHELAKTAESFMKLAAKHEGVSLDQEFSDDNPYKTVFVGATNVWSRQVEQVIMIEDEIKRLTARGRRRVGA